jgi:two-component system sensor histidine kinase PilS (NtrC family)
MDATDSRIVPPATARIQSQAAVDAQNWKLLALYNYYRLVIGLSATAVALSSVQIPPFGMQAPGLFDVASVLYALLGVVSFFTIRRGRPDFETQVTLQIFADIALITLLMHASGGVDSGLGLLLLVAVAGSSLMLDKRLAIFYAAWATLAVLIEHFWGWWVGRVETIELMQGYPKVGLLGIGLFATATLAYTLATRLRATEALAERRGIDLANLTQLNAHIIQRMHAGVLVCDREARIRLMNKTAENFLGAPQGTDRVLLPELSPELATYLTNWVANPGRSAQQPVRAGTGYVLLPRFITLGELPPHHAGTLIFLEDAAVLRQQAQQLKMAALARLTASIAHEIRNPLGAIANAAQLLSESTGGGGEEGRLVRIISEQSRRMNVIVENITQLSRRDKVNPVKLLLQPWLEEFTRHFAETVKVPPEAFAVYGTDGLQVCIDPDQFYQVVGNLSQNALRHSPPFNGNLVLKFQAGVNGDGRPFLDVIDWGTGVPEEIRDKIFEPFFTTTPRGTGLGLYIARELCEGNGATLDYHPGPGGVGSRFHITFARAEECSELGIYG